MDGGEYLPAVADAVERTRAGDALFVLGLQLDPDTDLRGRDPGEEGYLPVGEMLARAAARGVDVRVLLAGSVFTSGLPLKVGPFAANVAAAAALRRWIPDGARGEPPLADRVVLDWSGHRLGSNHQKAIVVGGQGQLVAFVGGIDLAPGRWDLPPHGSMERAGEPWGWHDAGQRLVGPAATDVWNVVRERWRDAASLPARPAWYREGGLGPLNPRPLPAEPGPPPEVARREGGGITVSVLRSYGPWKQHPPPPAPRRPWTHRPRGGVREIFATLSKAIDAARLYVYVEDQYFREYPGGDRDYELYPQLRDAAARGVRVLLLGSGVGRPDDVRGGEVNRELTADVRDKIVAQLPEDRRHNVAVYRVERVTVHSKVVLVDDRFACIGSANLFSRSMAGTDHELSVAVVDAGSRVRDLRIRLWSDHLRCDPDDPEVRRRLADATRSLGEWRDSWGTPGYRPIGRGPALKLVGP